MLSDPYAGLELSTQILIREALNRGIEAEVLDREDQFIRLKKDGRIEYVKQATRTSADTYISPLIMENKEVTKLILREHGIRVPEGITVRSLTEAESKAERFHGEPIVVKPKSTNFGKGVSVLTNGQQTDADSFANAVQYALNYDETVMIEKFLPGREYRFLIIGDETAAVLYRVPANVRGDGVRTIEQLVQQKNKDPLRGEGYVTPLERIKLGQVERDYLKSQGKHVLSVPEKDEIVYLRENSNISTGGDSIDCTDIMPEAYKEIAVRAAKAVGAVICGADMIIWDIQAAPGPDNYGIIELNFNPALHIHNFPYQGTNRRVETKVLDLLGY
ncbi:bifunctional glutamate--cysteine ligase GshA/glutathione synthetase GshB [Paenibacillus tarimensis]